MVVGGGNAAAEDAVFLSGLCKKVYLVHRRDELRADKAIQEKVFDCENIEMVWESIPLEILGQDEVTGIKIQNVKTGKNANWIQTAFLLQWELFRIRHL